MNEFRAKYNAHISKIYLIELYCHLPIFLFMAWFFETEWWIALGLSSAILALPTLNWLKDKSDVLNLYFISVSYIMFSGIMIHLGKGMIEMHFHIFVSLAVISVFGYKGPVLAAAGTAAIHYIFFWLFLPQSVFNYEANFIIVLVHAVFVIIETVPALYIAQKFYNFIHMQGEVLIELENMSDQLDEVSKENKNDAENLDFVSNNLNASCRQQAEAVRETVSSLNEINAMISMAHNHIEESHKLINEGKDVAVTGQADLSNLNLGIQEAEKSINQLEEIIKIVNQIKVKTNVINDIVFQTKLLSFNASVEAARAGEHGKGFAVVAEEVGKLAESSGKASQEIEDLLKGSNDKVGMIVESIKGSVSNGNTLTEKVINNFLSFNSKFIGVEESIESITTALSQLSILTTKNEHEAENLNSCFKLVSQRGQTLLELAQKIRGQVKEVRG